MNYEHEDDPIEEQAQEQTCKNCKFNKSWRCYRLPPQYAGTFEENQFSWKFPMIHPECWCGEWQPND